MSNIRSGRSSHSNSRTRKLRKGGADGAAASASDCQNPATFHGLHKWHNAMFEKLGWMVLAKAHGYDEKVSSYKTGLNRLVEKIQCKWDATREEDRKDDLKILLDNANVLLAHVASDFP